MFGPTKSFFGQSPNSVTLKIWFQTGANFEETFPLDNSTFADVKISAIRQLNQQNNLSTSRRSSFQILARSRTNFSTDQLNQYQLISIASKRTVQDEKSLQQGRLRDGDEFLLTTKKISAPTAPGKASVDYSLNDRLIESRTKNLPLPSRAFSREHRSAARREFLNDLNRILITLVETSQKLLWCHPDAENIFRHVEEYLLQSPPGNATTTSTTNSDEQNRRVQVSKLKDMGFTEHRARFALKRSRYDLHAAMEYLLKQPDIDESEEVEENDEPSQQNNSKTKNSRTPLFTRHGPFVSFRKYRQDQFRADPKAIQALKEIGFEQEQIVSALQIFNNDKDLACEYLLSNQQQQQTIREANRDQGLDPNSSLFQALMQNSIIHKTINNPKIFFILLQLVDNPSSITNYMNDVEIANLLLQVSRVYHSEKENLNPATPQRTEQDQQPAGLSRMNSNSLTGDFDDDDSDSD